MGAGGEMNQEFNLEERLLMYPNKTLFSALKIRPAEQSLS